MVYVIYPQVQAKYNTGKCVSSDAIMINYESVREELVILFLCMASIIEEQYNRQSVYHFYMQSRMI